VAAKLKVESCTLKFRNTDYGLAAEPEGDEPEAAEGDEENAHAGRVVPFVDRRNASGGGAPGKDERPDDVEAESQR